MRASGFVFAFILLGFVPHLGYAKERIQDYTVHVELRSDGVATIQEEITYDFGEDKRRGIYREIPLMFDLPGGSQQDISITNVSVRKPGGGEYPFTVSGGGNYVELKIGDPNVWITGKHLYVIRYDVLGAIYSSPLGTEFYWNAVGTSWSVPIDQVRLQVALPRTLPINDVKYGCYSGAYGSVIPCEEGIQEGVATDTVTMLRFLAKELPPRAGMSFSIALPEGELRISASTREKPFIPWWNNIKIGFSILLPIIVLVVMLRIWYLKGKDPEGRAVVTAEYQPPEGLSPLQISFLRTLRVSKEAVTAQIISLAQRGYFAIRVIEKVVALGLGKHHEVEITLKNSDLSSLKPYERSILKKMFPEILVGSVATQSDLQTRLQGLPQNISKQLSQEAVELGYYEKDPLKVRNSYLISGFAIFFLAFFASSHKEIAFSLALCGIIVGVVGWFLPRATKEGVKILDHIKGFCEYLDIAEKDRIAFHSDPKENRAIYEKLLPYAIVFGFGSAWLKWFDTFYADPNQRPSWISQVGGKQMAMSSLTQTLSSNLSTSMTATKGSGSGGGGFSGGGGGGGGGRSW